MSEEFTVKSLQDFVTKYGGYPRSIYAFLDGRMPPAEAELFSSLVSAATIASYDMIRLIEECRAMVAETRKPLLTMTPGGLLR